MTSKSPGVDTAMAMRGYSDASFLLHQILSPKGKKRGKPPWKNPRFCTSESKFMPMKSKWVKFTTSHLIWERFF